MIDFSKNLYSEEYSFKDTQELRPAMRGDVQTSDDISGIEVRLSKVYIIDNKTQRFGPFPQLWAAGLLILIYTKRLPIHSQRCMSLIISTWCGIQLWASAMALMAETTALLISATTAR